MLKSLKVVLEVQELDMNMFSLMRLKKKSLKELEKIENLRNELKKQRSEKEIEIAELNRMIASQESETLGLRERYKKLDNRLQSVKKVDEYQAINKEMIDTNQEIKKTEAITSDLIDKRNFEEEFCKQIKESLQQSEESSAALEQEIQEKVRLLNKDGSVLMAKRQALAETADPDVMQIYQRLLDNKKDRVVVPISNGNCSGCNISITAQHQNTVQRAERLVFCEHCSRIHYHHQEEILSTEEGGEAGVKRRRRRKVIVAQ